jgi:hypothetical protein
MNTPRLITIGLAASVAAIAPTTALAKRGGDDTTARGACSKGSTAKLKVKPDNGRLETEFEVDQNRNGVPWNVQLSRNGKVVFSGLRTTHAPSGSFSLERRIASGAASVIRASASRAGEVCSAAIPARTTVPAPVATTAAPAAAGVKLRGDGTVDDTQPTSTVAAPVADDHGGHTGSDDGGHHGSDD